MISTAFCQVSFSLLVLHSAATVVNNDTAAAENVSTDTVVVRADPGQPFSLQCHPESDPNTTDEAAISWRKDGEDWTDEVKLAHLGYSLTTKNYLTVAVASSHHQGLYQCIRQLDNETTYTVIQTFNVTMSELQLEFISPLLPNVIKKDEGNDLILTCRPTGETSLTWLKDGLPISPTQNIINFFNGTLLLHHVTAYNQGLYTCLAQNEKDMKEQNVNLQVTTVPRRVNLGLRFLSLYSAEIRWTPGYDGGYPITGYTLQYRTAGKSHQLRNDTAFLNTTASQHRVILHLLQPKKLYYVTVCAVNKLGRGYQASLFFSTGGGATNHTLSQGSGLVQPTRHESKLHTHAKLPVWMVVMVAVFGVTFGVMLAAILSVHWYNWRQIRIMERTHTRLRINSEGSDSANADLCNDRRSCSHDGSPQWAFANPAFEAPEQEEGEVDLDVSFNANNSCLPRSANNDLTDDVEEIESEGFDYDQEMQATCALLSESE